MRRALVAALGVLIAGCAVGASREEAPDEQDAASVARGAPIEAAAESGADAAPDGKPDAGTPACDETTSGNSYAAQYMEALQRGTVKRCAGGCTAGECCYQLSACVVR